MFTHNKLISLIVGHLKVIQTDIKGNVILVWFFVFVGQFVLAISYFYLYPAVHETLSALSSVSCMDGCSAPGGLNQTWFVNYDNTLDLNWRFAHLMIGIGLIIYGVLRSIRREHDTFAQQY